MKYIHDSGLHLLDLINQVLELSKIEAGNLEISIQDIKLSEIMTECLPLLQSQAEKKDVQIILVDCPNIIVRADRLLFKQVILNLATNAIKYNKQGGTITLDCHEVEHDHVRNMVTDTGMGIAKDKQSQLFTAFSRLGKENSTIEGTGIGLTITKRIVEAMNGHIGFESTEGKGSTFWIDLPVAKESGESHI